MEVETQGLLPLSEHISKPACGHALDEDRWLGKEDGVEEESRESVPFEFVG